MTGCVACAATLWLIGAHGGLGDLLALGSRLAPGFARTDLLLGVRSAAGSWLLHVPSSIRTTGVPRNRVDPTTWDAIRKVGRHVDVQRDGSVSVDIDCLVERPQH